MHDNDSTMSMQGSAEVSAPFTKRRLRVLVALWILAALSSFVPFVFFIYSALLYFYTLHLVISIVGNRARISADSPEHQIDFIRRFLLMLFLALIALYVLLNLGFALTLDGLSELGVAIGFVVAATELIGLTGVLAGESYILPATVATFVAVLYTIVAFAINQFGSSHRIGVMCAFTLSYAGLVHVLRRRLT